VLLANYVNQEVPFAYRIDPAKFGLEGGRYRLVEITPEGERAMGTAEGVVERSEVLGPRALKVVEIMVRAAR
jgi:hypothetical protein